MAIAIDDMIIWRFHIAMLKRSTFSVLSRHAALEKIYTRITMIREANAQLTYGNACVGETSHQWGVRRH